MRELINHRAILMIMAAMLSLGLVACGDDDEEGPAGVPCTEANAAEVCGGFACDIQFAGEGVCKTTCTSTADCLADSEYQCLEVPAPETSAPAEGEEGAEEAAEEAPAAMMACIIPPAESSAAPVSSGEPLAPFTFVGVLSTTASPEGSTPGPNVDAIEVIRGGASVFAQSVAANLFVQGSGNAEPAANAATSAIGNPSIRSEFEGAQECDDAVSANTYALGATGGYIVVAFGDFELQDGDTVRVWETSNPPCTNFTARNPGDTYELFVGRSDALDTRFDGEGWLSQGSISVAGPRAFTLALPSAAASE